MSIEKLDHVNLRTTRLEEMIAWYRDVLGLNVGPRPDFPFKGAWLYAGEAACVHLVEIDGDEATGSETALKLEHFAFTASEREEFESRLKELGVTCRRVENEEFATIACNMCDPDGNHIHVDFRSG
ncbi:MAG: VOC family protein [Roseobacter sp.]